MYQVLTTPLVDYNIFKLHDHALKQGYPVL